MNTLRTCAVVGALTGVLLAAALLSGVPAARPASIQACGAVSRTTTMRADCAGPLVVTASNVRLNLAGHTISCRGGDGPGLVLRGVSHVVVVGSLETDWSDGKDTDADHRPSITACGTGVLVAKGGWNSLVGLRVSGNAGTGIVLQSTVRNSVASTASSGNRGLGILVDGSRGNSFKNVWANGNDGPGLVGGMFIPTSSTDNVITHATLEHNGDWGVRIDGARNAVTGSVVSQSANATTRTAGIIVQGSGNTIADSTVDGNLNGIDLRCGIGNTLQGNVVLDNDRFGIVIRVPQQFLCAAAFPPSENVVRGNRASGNGWRDLGDYHLECDTNTWSANLFATRDPDCIG